MERVLQARAVHDAGRSYALAMYLSGLAVECLLRAFRWDKDRSFEGRHDLRELLRASGLVTIDARYRAGRPAAAREPMEGSVLTAAMSEVALLWHNNLRFASESSAQAFLKRIGRDRGVRGDPLKKNSSDLLTAAKTVIDRGTLLWTFERKSPRP